jgi:hypothetical protein
MADQKPEVVRRPDGLWISTAEPMKTYKSKEEAEKSTQASERLTTINREQKKQLNQVE